jgi:hypothetical protein
MVMYICMQTALAYANYCQHQFASQAQFETVAWKILLVVRSAAARR